jgi:hypothetical protein
MRPNRIYVVLFTSILFLAGSLVVPIPIGSTFSIPVDLEKYGPFGYKLKPGTYSLEARLTGKDVNKQMPTWT